MHLSTKTSKTFKYHYCTSNYWNYWSKQTIGRSDI